MARLHDSIILNPLNIAQDLRWRLAEYTDNIKYLTSPTNARRIARATIKTIEENEGLIKECKIKLALMNESELTPAPWEDY